MSRPTGRLFGWALALLAIALFCSLGMWQLDRGRQKEPMLAEARKILVERRPQALAAAADPARATRYDWAQGAGRFADAPAVLLDNQTQGGRSGVRVFRVFQPDSGSPPLLVELGWLPLPGDRKLPTVGPVSDTQQVAGLLAPLAVSVSWQASERVFQANVLALREQLEALHDHLAPETLVKVERALATIDLAIAEGREALLRDPANAALSELVASNYRQKIELLRRMTQLASS